MRNREASAAVIAAIVILAAIISWLSWDTYQREYKDAYEQMRMERMITGRETGNESRKGMHRAGEKI